MFLDAMSGAPVQDCPGAAPLCWLGWGVPRTLVNLLTTQLHGESPEIELPRVSV